MKNCDQGLQNAARGRRPRAAFSSPRSQFFTIRTSQLANNIYIMTSADRGSIRFLDLSLQRGYQCNDAVAPSHDVNSPSHHLLAGRWVRVRLSFRVPPFYDGNPPSSIPRQHVLRLGLGLEAIFRAFGITTILLLCTTCDVIIVPST